jgi:hypothetical protein
MLRRLLELTDSSGLRPGVQDTLAPTCNPFNELPTRQSERGPFIPTEQRLR